MIDGIIKADGTSRLMRANLPATYEELRAQAAAGTLPLDVLFNGAGWSQLPTFLNKANLLTDDTAAQYGLEGVVPNDIFSWLGKYNEHWWSLLHGTGETTYTHSTDRNAYPDSGTVDGITYTYLGVPFERLPSMLRAETGSYTGTGTSGSSNKNTLTFSGKPLFVVVSGDTQFFAVRGSSITGSAEASTASSSRFYNKLVWGDSSLSWYDDYGSAATTDAKFQCNTNGVTYYYLALVE